MSDRKIQPGRLRDAREYVGFTVAGVARALGCEAGDLARMEDGEAATTGEHLRKLSRLYRRPVAWFLGESRFEPDAALLRMVEGQTEHDRSAILDFAEWLQGAGPPERPARPIRNDAGSDHA